ncbi:glycosyltransferase family 4 protein [Curtobacterium flaccumfaciens]|uniref:glycosyltransferase family 4 protein n=1 Tax=Curtobacterium flaccumfaciens TaxID=2035 RepID=UPI00217CD9FD|nr:glycosyltransferase family 4 protein [Curtobacterium flaccumfaciens]MCS6529418.1 glycosyltransferase [Curtobacterium flaccumfaciens pv. flaccumfaciens]
MVLCSSSWFVDPWSGGRGPAPRSAARHYQGGPGAPWARSVVGQEARGGGGGGGGRPPPPPPPPPPAPSIATRTTSLAHRLRAAGHRVRLLSWRAQYALPPQPGRHGYRSPNPRSVPTSTRDGAPRLVRPDELVARRLVVRRADVVLVTAVTPYHAVPYAVLRLALGRRPRTVVLAHNVLPHEHGQFDEALVRLLQRQYGAVLVHSEEQAELARGILGAGSDVDVRVARLRLADLLLGEPAEQELTCPRAPMRTRWSSAPSA